MSKRSYEGRYGEEDRRYGRDYERERSERERWQGGAYERDYGNAGWGRGEGGGGYRREGGGYQGERRYSEQRGGRGYEPFPPEGDAGQDWARGQGGYGPQGGYDYGGYRGYGGGRERDWSAEERYGRMSGPMSGRGEEQWGAGASHGMRGSGQPGMRGRRGGEMSQEDSGYGGWSQPKEFAGYDEVGDASGRHMQHDPDYHQWRSEQMRNLDNDYSEWRKERYKKFSEDFDQWRSSRAGRSMASGGQPSQGPGSSGASGGSTSVGSGSGTSGLGSGSSATGSGLGPSSGSSSGTSSGGSTRSGGSS